MKLKRLGLDTSKAVFTVHGVDHDEKVVLRRNIRRAELEAFFAKLPPTHVALEACGGSHHWGRRLAALGHAVRAVQRSTHDAHGENCADAAEGDAMASI